MAIKFEYDSDQKILLIKVIGEIKVEDYSNLMKVELPSRNIPIDTNAIWDLSEMDFSVLDIELEREINKVREKIDEKRQGTKIALVSDYDLGEPILKMFLIISQHLSQEIKMIKTVEKAKEWLSEKQT
jgi:hypothetical protein